MQRTRFLLLAVALSACGGDDATPIITTDHGGETLGHWMASYWRFAVGDGAATETDVAFLPLPNGTDPDMDGTFTGTLSTSVAADQTLALPLFVWLGESYTAATMKAPDVPDTDAPVSLFTGATMHVSLTVDDTVVFDTNAGDDLNDIFFDTETFVPSIAYAMPTSYGADHALWVRGIGVLINPLSSGTHTVHLVERNDELMVGYDNTWTITVP